MKVLIVSNGFPPSGQWGTEFYTYQLAKGLVGRGHEVTVLGPLRDGSKPRYTVERSLRYGIPLVEIHNAGDPRKRLEDSYRNPRVEELFGELLASLEPDVVHFNHLLWGLSVRLPVLAHAAGIATVATITDYGLVCHRGQLLDWRLERCAGPEAARCARCVREPGLYDARAVPRVVKRWTVRGLSLAGGLGLVVGSEDMRERQREVDTALRAIDHFLIPTEVVAHALRDAGVPPDRLTHLCYGLDEEPYRSAPSTTDPGQVRFGFLGQFLPHKGLHVLLDAVRLMRNRLPESVEPWELRVHGNGVQGRHQRYLDAIWSPDLAPRVRLEGPFEPLRAPAVLADLDLVVVPSLWDENAPLTILQARAAGVPVIASDVPGVREVVATGPEGGGVLVPPGDPAALAEALRHSLFERPVRDPHRAPPPVTYREHLERVEAHYRDLLAVPVPRVPAPTPVAG